MTAPRVRKHWGWGFEDEELPRAEIEQAAAGFSAHIGFGTDEIEDPKPLDEIELRAPRVNAPAELAHLADSSTHARVFHSHGAAYRDVVRAFRGEITNPTDVVLRPQTEADIAAIFQWCSAEGVAAIPFGGGTSVVGGVEPSVGSQFAGVATLDLSAFNRLEEVDGISGAARIGGGATGPQLEQALSTHGLTLRCYPQSFQFSTLGGWIVTRAGGHFATAETHIDDLLESARAVTPVGVWDSRRLPGSGAGPSPDQMLLGSEGTLGVVTSAWVRVRPKPGSRAQTSVQFPSFRIAAEAVREIVQARLRPANLRLLDPSEAALTGAGDGQSAVLVVGFEAESRDVSGELDQALAICSVHGGKWERVSSGGREGASGAWREAFLRAPYLRDTFVRMGVLSETFETAVTWDKFPDLLDSVTDAVESALKDVCGAGRVSCRFTHVYPDGPAPYFTVLAPADRGSEVAQWDAIKRAAGDALIAAGGTITHHHAVGRDHRPWYDQQRPEVFARAFSAAKAAVDPAGILNPGVLIGP
ncbi:MAG: FAD-binding oxidoreductase [Actinomycetes bacterium]